MNLPHCPTCDKQLSRLESKTCKKHVPGKDQRISVLCFTCGNTKKVKNSKYKRLGHHFCDRECFGKWKSINAKELGFGTQKLSDETKSKISLLKGGTGIPYDKSCYPICLNCDKRLSRRDAIRCDDCSGKFMVGENHPMFGKNHTEEARKKISLGHGGTGVPYENADYPKEFYAMKDKILERDNWICQGEDCNVTQEEHLIVYGCSLHVHHIDYNKKNNHESNLISACLQCNTRANYNKDYWRGFYQNKIFMNTM